MTSFSSRGQAAASPAPDLGALRVEIDRIDEALHGLLMERGAIIDQLIAVKARGGGGSAFRPGREAEMMRRLVQRHAGILPLDTVESIWRIIISTFTYVQAPYAVHADTAGGDATMRDSCRFHFGFTVPLVTHVGAPAVIAAVAWVILRNTPLGDYLLAVGGNEEAARVSGVPIGITKIAAYAMNGIVASVAAMILIAWLGAADPTLGNLWELQAIAAAAIGGASLMGGKGSIVGTVLGAVILGTVSDGLTLLNVQAFYQLLATGLIIIAAMLIDRATRS